VDLSFGERYEDFRQQTRNFLKEYAHLATPGFAATDREKTRRWQELLIENGYVARAIPKKYGGYGAQPDLLEARIISEEFATAQVAQGLGGQGIAYLVPTLLELGSENRSCNSFRRP